MAASKRKRAWAASLGFLALGVLVSYLARPPTHDTRLTGTVSRVLDGDTFDFLAPSGVMNIRLWGIDAPEARTDDGRAASEFLRDLVRGQTLTCEVPPTGQLRGPYRRFIRLCRIDGRDIAEILVEVGHAEDAPDYSGGRYAAR